MDDMVKKVARALRKDTEENGAGYCVAANIDWDAAARVAIEAMREPTPEMIAAEDIHWDYSCHVCGGAKESWQTMIDAALGSKGG